MVLFFVIGFGITLIIMLSMFQSDVRKNMGFLNKRLIQLQKELKEKEGVVQTSKEAVQKKEQPDFVPFKTAQEQAKPSLEVSGQKPPVSKPADELKQQENLQVEEKPADQKPEVIDISKKSAEKTEEELSPEVTQEKAEETKKASASKEEEKAAEKPKVAAMTKTPEIISVSKSSAQAETVKPSYIDPKGHSGAQMNEEKDFEKVIGENWLNKIGIAILVIGIGFFVKYAIDKNWIGEWGRVGIGVLTGGVMIGIAHYLRKSYRAFSSVLIGGGISVFYYTISIAYHDYSLFTQVQAFSIMTGITLLATVMALLYDRRELAIIGLIGGFTSPFMVQGETANYHAFFTYLAILNTGMLFLSFFKKWSILHRLALGFTVLFFGSWMFMEDVTFGAKQSAGLMFSSIYFVQFLSMNLWYNLSHKVKFNAWEFIQLLSVTVMYYGGMMYLLSYVQFGAYEGMFTLLMAIIFFGIAIGIKTIQSADENLVKLMIGKVVTFTTLTALVQLEGNYVTLFWALEGVILLWIAQRSNMQLLKNASLIVTFVAGFSLLRDWVMLYYMDEAGQLPVIFNKAFMTSIFTIGTFIVASTLLKRENSDNKFLIYPVKNYRMLLNGLAIFGVYATCLLELIEQSDRIGYGPGEELVLWVYHFMIIIGGMILGMVRKSDLLKQVFFVTGIMACLVYVVVAHLNNIEIRNDVISGIASQGVYYAHFILSGLFLTVLVMMRKLSFKIFEDQHHINLLLVLLSLFGIFLATAELDQIAVYAFADNLSEVNRVLSHTQTAGYTVLWGIYSFVLMIYGMKKKARFIRVFSLVIFSITLGKLFIMDIRNISEGGKILAFISLGVLLLVVSFLYQKLRKIIVEGEA